MLNLAEQTNLIAMLLEGFQRDLNQNSHDVAKFLVGNLLKDDQQGALYDWLHGRRSALIELQKQALDRSGAEIPPRE